MERMIRTTSKVLLGVLPPTTRLTDEILETVLCEVEIIINIRPITRVSDDVNDFASLTHNQLLTMRGNFGSLTRVFTQADMYKKIWRYVQFLADQFRKRWTKQYIPSLQMRSKWLKLENNIKKGDLVLIMENNSPRFLWPLGLVFEANVGRDNPVRSDRLKTRSTELVRPITKLVLLDGNINPTDDN